MSDTPRTDAMRLKMAQLGWSPDGEPVAMMMASHDKMERELADLNDQITILRSDLKRLEGFAKTYRLRADEAEDQLAAERALADRLADSLRQSNEGFGDRLPCEESCECAGRRIVKANDLALAAWKEARSGDD